MNTYHMRGETQNSSALKFVSRQKTAVRSPIFVGCHNLEMFATSSKDCCRHHVSVPDF